MARTQHFAAQLVSGFLAGMSATGPMTMVMSSLHRRLPASQRKTALPPRQIAMRLAEAVGVRERLNEQQKQAMTLSGHFLYGGAAGMLYAAFADRIAGPPAIKGAAYGLAVWAGSYLGWLPAAGLFPRATKDRAERNSLMIAAHLAWGAANGMFFDELQRARSQNALGFEGDLEHKEHKERSSTASERFEDDESMCALHLQESP